MGQIVQIESKYKIVESEFMRLCNTYKIPQPTVIRPALDTDPCDYTDPLNEVRINTDPEKMDCEPIYQARHLFGHYISDLHSVNDEYSDIVADTVADLLFTTWGDEL